MSTSTELRETGSYRNIPTIYLDTNTDSASDGGHSGIVHGGDSPFTDENSRINVPHLLNWLSCLGSCKKYIIACVLLSRCECSFHHAAGIINGWNASHCKLSTQGTVLDYERLDSIHITQTSDSNEVIKQLLESLQHLPNSPANPMKSFWFDNLPSDYLQDTPSPITTETISARSMAVKQRYIQLTLELISSPSSFSDILDELCNRESEMFDCEFRETVVQLPITCLLLSLLLHPGFTHEDRTNLLGDVRAYVKSTSHDLLQYDIDVSLPLRGISKLCHNSVSASIRTALHCKILECVMELAIDMWYVLQYFQNGAICIDPSLPHSLTSSGFISSSGGGSDSQYDLLSETVIGQCSGPAGGGSHYGALLTVPHPLSLDARHSFSGCTSGSVIVGPGDGQRRFSSDGLTNRCSNTGVSLPDSSAATKLGEDTNSINATSPVKEQCVKNGNEQLQTSPPRCPSPTFAKLSSEVTAFDDQRSQPMRSPSNTFTLPLAYQDHSVDNTEHHFQRPKWDSQLLRSQQVQKDEVGCVEQEAASVRQNVGMLGVPAWLKSLRLHKYAVLFRQLTYEELMNIDETWLEQQDVTRGARNKILLNLRKLQSRSATISLAESQFSQAGTTASAFQAMCTCLSEITTILQTPIKPCRCHPTTFYVDRNTYAEVPDTSMTSAQSVIGSNHVSTQHYSLPAWTKKSQLAQCATCQLGSENQDECLPCQIINCLLKVCSRLLVSPQPDIQCCSRFMQVLDTIGSHPSFLDRHKNLATSWKQGIFSGRRTWLPLDVNPLHTTFPVPKSRNAPTALLSNHLQEHLISHPFNSKISVHHGQKTNYSLYDLMDHQLSPLDPRAFVYSSYSDNHLVPSVALVTSPNQTSATKPSLCTTRRHSVPINREISNQQPTQAISVPTKPRPIRRMPSPGATITTTNANLLFTSHRSSSPTCRAPLFYPLSPLTSRYQVPHTLSARSTMDVSSIRPASTTAVMSGPSSVPPLGSGSLHFNSPQLTTQHYPRYGFGRGTLFPPATAPPTRMPSPSDVDRRYYRQQLGMPSPVGVGCTTSGHDNESKSVQVHNGHWNSAAEDLSHHYQRPSVRVVSGATSQTQQAMVNDSTNGNGFSSCMLRLDLGHLDEGHASCAFDRVNRDTDSMNLDKWLTKPNYHSPENQTSSSIPSSDHIEHDLDILAREVTELAIGDFDSPVG